MKAINIKIISGIILLAALFTLLGSCQTGGDSGKTDKPTGAPEKTDAETTTEAMTERLYPDLAPQDFGGYEFRVLYRGPGYVNSYWRARDIYAEEENGDPINDAVYKRNKTIEEKYNIVIAGVPENGQLPVFAQRMIRAGDDSFDVMSDEPALSNNIISSGGFVNLHSIASVDISKPWWDKNAAENLSINGKLYFTASDYIILEKDATSAVLFSKQMIQNFGLADPYRMVRGGTWTLDRMNEMARAVTLDLNGDGIIDDEDQWGLVGQNHTAYVLFKAAGEYIAKINSSGEPEVTMGNQRAVAILDKITEMQAFTIKADAYSSKYGDAVWDIIQLGIFEANRGLFLCRYVEAATKLRESDVDFGIIPPPKFDENQNGYFINGGLGCGLAIPVTVTDKERTGIILDALSAESRYTLIPAYYDITLKTKLARDDESSEMLDIIFANRIFDLGWNYARGIVYPFFNELSEKQTNNIASFLEKNEGKISAAMEEAVQAVNDID